MPGYQPHYPTDVSGTVFEALGTNTWESDAGITTAWDIDLSYEQGLSDIVAAGDLNGLSAREEQFLADIVEGVIIDELAEVKYNSQPYDRIANNSEILASNHPVYILSDGSGGQKM